MKGVSCLKVFKISHQKNNMPSYFFQKIDYDDLTRLDYFYLALRLTHEDSVKGDGEPPIFGPCDRKTFEVPDGGIGNLELMESVFQQEGYVQITDFSGPRKPPKWAPQSL
jgi:hypothetical protein